jgi:hypothetical protein
MPSVSQAQRAAMFAAAAGKSTLGIPQKVGQEFADADEGGKLPARKKAPPKVASAFRRGRISAKVMAKRGYDSE